MSERFVDKVLLHELGSTADLRSDLDFTMNKIYNEWKN